MNKLQIIRQKEKEYHDHCYQNYKLFEEGSWLHKPVKTILELFDIIKDRENIAVLDMGCGVGRNSIPLAQKLINKKGNIVCIDLLDSAIEKLVHYAKVYGVEKNIKCKVTDIGDFNIEHDTYDYIFSVSSLEHLSSEEILDKIISDMIAGTKCGGINCFIINTNITETELETGTAIEPMFELLFKTDYLLDKFSTQYNKWNIIKQTIKPYKITINREGKSVLLQGDVVTWAVQKI